MTVRSSNPEFLSKREEKRFLAKEIAVACRCPRCEEVNLVRVGADDIVAWKVDGVPVQGAFPYLDADQREMLMTGICGTCWDKMFAEDGEQ